MLGATGMLSWFGRKTLLYVFFGVLAVFSAAQSIFTHEELKYLEMVLTFLYMVAF